MRGKKMPTVNVLLDRAKAELSQLLPGEVFFVRNLFKEYERNRISRSDRLLLDTLFLNFIKTVDIGIEPIEERSSGQQRYQMII